MTVLLRRVVRIPCISSVAKRGVRNPRMLHPLVGMSITQHSASPPTPQSPHCRWKSTAALAVEPEDQDDEVVIPFLLADIGEGIAEVEVLQWFVRPGDTVCQFDKICEVQSDKATVEITSRYDGRVESVGCEAGSMLAVGQPLLQIAVASATAPKTAGGSAPSALEQEQKQEGKSTDEESKLWIPSVASKFHLPGDDTPSSPTSISTVPEGEMLADGGFPVLTTPAVRKLAKEYQLDLRTLVGTGPKGRILKGDVLNHLRTTGKMPPLTTSAAPSSLSEAPSKATTTTVASSPITPSAADDNEDTVMVPLRGYNRLMVQSMTASLQIPHMVYSDEVYMDALWEMRKEIGGILPLCIKATSLALQSYPLLNSVLDLEHNQIIQHKRHHIGVAMDTPRGLVVPVIHNVQAKSIADIADDLARLKELGQSASLSKDDLTGATFSLSNIGAIGCGGTYMSPIVTPPQVGIGALGRLQRLPRFVDDASDRVEAVRVGTISWGADHRVVDGATLARFHNQWKSFVESPTTMLKEMK